MPKLPVKLAGRDGLVHHAVQALVGHLMVVAVEERAHAVGFHHLPDGLASPPGAFGVPGPGGAVRRCSRPTPRSWRNPRRRGRSSPGSDVMPLPPTIWWEKTNLYLALLPARVDLSQLNWSRPRVQSQRSPEPVVSVSPPPTVVVYGLVVVVQKGLITTKSASPQVQE